MQAGGRCAVAPQYAGNGPVQPRRQGIAARARLIAYPRIERVFIVFALNHLLRPAPAAEWRPTTRLP